jgi:hypothetical protein
MTVPIESLAAFALTGAGVGFLAGLIGIGGGLILVPVLLAVFAHSGLPLAAALPIAAGTSLAAIVSTSALSALAHRRSGALDLALWKSFVLPVTIGAAAGPLLALHVPTAAIQLAIIALYGCVVWSFLVPTSAMRTSPAGAAWFAALPPRARAVVERVAGASVGAFAGVAGVGGNTLLVPLLAKGLGVPFRSAVGVSAGLAVPLALAGMASYLFRAPESTVSLLAQDTIGSIHVPAVAGLALGSACTVRLGATLAKRVNTIWLQRLFAVAVLASMLALLRSLWPAADVSSAAVSALPGFQVEIGWAALAL